MATQLAEARTLGGALQEFNGQLKRQTEEFRAALPAGIKPEHFQRVVMTAVTSDPELLRCDRRSLINSCMKAAQDGLVPDKREAALVVYVSSKKVDGQWVKVKEAQYLPMVYGLRKKILQSEEVTDIFTAVVYRREWEEGYFIYEEGTERMLRHKPMLDLSDEDCADDKIIAAYSMATLKDGSRSFEVMRRSDINKVRQASQTGALGKTKRDGTPIEPKGPWVDWFAEMAKKTVMRRHSKVLPMSSDLIDIEGYEMEIAARSTQQLLASDTPDEPVALPSRDDPPHDPATGELTEATEQVARVDQRADAEAARRAAEDEETARRLDAGQGGDGDDGGDDQPVEAAKEESAPAKTAKDAAPTERQAASQPAEEPDDGINSRVKAVLEEIGKASSKLELGRAERNYLRDRVAFDEPDIATIENALTEARKRLAGN